MRRAMTNGIFRDFCIWVCHLIVPCHIQSENNSTDHRWVSFPTSYPYDWPFSQMSSSLSTTPSLSIFCHLVEVQRWTYAHVSVSPNTHAHLLALVWRWLHILALWHPVNAFRPSIKATNTCISYSAAIVKPSKPASGVPLIFGQHRSKDGDIKGDGAYYTTKCSIFHERMIAGNYR